jgi:hypothetical protein
MESRCSAAAKRRQQRRCQIVALALDGGKTAEPRPVSFELRVAAKAGDRNLRSLPRAIGALHPCGHQLSSGAGLRSCRPRRAFFNSAANRPDRLANAWAIGEGLIMTGHRKIRDSAGGETHALEIYLPLSDRPSTDMRLYLMNSDWRPVGDDWLEGRVNTNLDLTLDPHAAALESYSD